MSAPRWCGTEPCPQLFDGPTKGMHVYEDVGLHHVEELDITGQYVVNIHCYRRSVCLYCRKVDFLYWVLNYQLRETLQEQVDEEIMNGDFSSFENLKFIDDLDEEDD